MEAAARWHAQLEAGTADVAAFEAWRDADPLHGVAFARIAGVAGQFDRVRPYFSPEVGLPDRRRHTRLAAGVIAGLLLGSLAAFGIWRAVRPHEVKTGVGVERIVQMPDGTRLLVNTDSAMTWSFDRARRRIWLQNGEIALTVHPDARPLSVYGGQGAVQVNAGSINARLRDHTVDLTVLSGQAEAWASGGAPPPAHVRATLVAAGQGALIEPQAVHVRSLSRDDMQFISGWQNGELVLNGQTLGAVVQEYDRYLAHRIVVVDPSLDGIRLGGRFATHDPERFLGALATGFDIHVARDGSGTVQLSR